MKSGPTDEPVLYWMNRDQRLTDNHALALAQALATEYAQPLLVFYGFDNSIERHNRRQVAFCIDSLRQLEARFGHLGIPFIVRCGAISTELQKIINKYAIGTVVTDFSPLREDKKLLEEVQEKSKVGFYLVDAHNIVPCWVISDKREYAAYTIRRKIKTLLDEYRSAAPEIVKHPFKSETVTTRIDWPSITNQIKTDSTPTLFEPGEDAALRVLSHFVTHKLAAYAERRNDPNADNQSNLSPYLHFGQISARTVLEHVQRAIEPCDALDQFVDELVIRKELSDNFCHYTDNYDTTDAFPDWAKRTLGEHQNDPREYLYGPDEFEHGTTHDPLWNAAQHEMVSTGKMHGYMRMYWAKKILEWTPSAAQAMEIAIYLNDKYELDSHDPNGYAGIAWSVGGVHDRPWFERDIFGKVRYMSYSGCRRKFDVDEYVRRTHSTP